MTTFATARGSGPAELSPPLRIGLLASPWLPVPPPAYGGTENMVDVLARALTAAGHDVLLYTTGDATCPVPRASTFDHALGVGSALFQEGRQVVAAYQLFQDSAVDVVHDHTLIGPRYASWFPELKVVTTNHGPFDRRANALYRTTSRRVPVIAISARQASTAAPGIVRAVVHHGIDTDQIPVGAGDGGYALFLGRMHPDKGVDLAIAAARAVQMPLLIAAKMREPAEREYFDAVIAPRLGDGVNFVGEVSRGDKMALLGSAACLLNPIRWAEPFGMVMIEALACGTPVVALDSGSVPEIVDDGKTGFVCSNFAGVVAALDRVGELSRSSCRLAAEHRFSGARMAADYVEVYRAVLAGMAQGVPASTRLAPVPSPAHPAGRAREGLRVQSPA